MDIIKNHKQNVIQPHKTILSLINMNILVIFTIKPPIFLVYETLKVGD